MTAVTSDMPTDQHTIWQRLVLLQRKVPVLQVLLLVIAFVFGAVTLPGFASVNSMKSVLILASLVGLAAIGQTVVVLIGGIDMSVANFIVVGALMVTQMSSLYDLSFGVAVAILIPGTFILGGLVGYICNRFAINPLIVTLAMGSIALGLLQVQTTGTLAGGAPAWLTGLTSPLSSTFGLPIPPILSIWIVVAVLLAVFIHRTPAGRRLQATGANPRAAGYSLVKTRRVWVIVFAFSAMCAALAGVLLAAFAGNVDPTLGGPYLFQSLAAVIVGGTAFGGPGDYTRTIVGATLLTVLTTVLIGHGLTGSDQQILYGVIILVAMAIYGREKKLRDRI